MTLTYFWLWSRSKCPDWNETRTWRVTPPTACINQVSNWYLKTCRKKARKTSKNSKRTKIIAKILKIIFLQKTELKSSSIQQATCVPNFKNLSWFMRPWLQKWVWSTSGCKRGQSDPIVMQLKLDMSCHLLNVYQVSNWYLKACWKKVRKTWTDGRTDGHCHGIIRPFFKRAYKKGLTEIRVWISNYIHYLYGM